MSENKYFFVIHYSIILSSHGEEQVLSYTRLWQLIPMLVGKRPWEEVAINFVAELSEWEGYNAILEEQDPSYQSNSNLWHHTHHDGSRAPILFSYFLQFDTKSGILRNLAALVFKIHGTNHKRGLLRFAQIDFSDLLHTVQTYSTRTTWEVTSKSMGLITL